MSTISELWNHAKGLQKEAGGKTELAVKGIKKLIPGGAASKLDSGLSSVTANIDEVLPGLKQPALKEKGFGRVVKPQVAESGPTIRLGELSYAGNAARPMKTLKDYVSGAKAWDGLTPGAKLGVKGTALAGGLGLSNMQGRSAGKETGMEIGSGQGYDAGIADANAMQSSMDPGVLGRLMEVFTGRQQSTINTSDPQMAARRQAVIQNILSGGR